MLKSKIGFVVILLLSAILFFVNKDVSEWKEARELEWDTGGYYSYLPAIFIYEDLKTMSFYSDKHDEYELSFPGNRFGVIDIKDSDNVVIKYPLGVAIMEMPLFFLADYLTVYHSDYVRDGYSPLYQLSAVVSTVLFSILGYIILIFWLRRYYSDNIVALVIFILGLGTNMYAYMTILPGYSHNFVFFLYAGILNLTDLLYRKPTWPYSILLGLLLGMVLITRPVDILIIIFPLFWLLYKPKEMLQFYQLNLKYIIAAILAMLIPLLVQLSYWKMVSGSWIYWSYNDEGFNFNDPEIYLGLFSYRKGWFVYTPLALLGFIGLVPLFRHQIMKNFILPFCIFFPVFWYVVFSWHQWFYGGGFGSRPMIETYAILALPMAALFKQIYMSRKIILKSIFTLILIFGLYVNIIQTWQYSKGIIHWDSMHKDYYWQIFLKRNITSEDREVFNR